MAMLPQHILIVRLSAMGDVAMTIPVLKVLTEAYPEVKLTVLTKEQFTPIFKDLEKATVVNVKVKGEHKGIFGLWRLSRQIKDLQIDAVADLHNVLRSKILKLFLGSTKWVSINKGRTEKNLLVKGRQFKQLKSTHQRYADVFEALGFKLELPPLIDRQKLNLKPDTKNLLANNSMTIGVAPFAAFSSKAYPLNLMLEVITELSKMYRILLFGGGKTETAKLESLASQFDNVYNIAGQLKFEEELNLISNLDLMIAMDSGNAHLAAMYGVQTITIWGVTHPYAGFSPFGQSIDNAILADRNTFPKIPTSIYGNKYPNGYENAIATILPEQIVKRAKSILGS